VNAPGNRTNRTTEIGSFVQDVQFNTL